MKTLFNSLCNIELLTQAWLIVLEKKSAGGIDKISLEKYAQNANKHLFALLDKLQKKRWKPQPYLRISIPKKTSESRELGLLSIEDKIVQQAIKLLIEPILDKRFYNCSYAYRPNRGHLKAIKRAIHECKQIDNKWILKLDIDNYFDNIDHTILFSRLKNNILDEEICRLIELSVKMGKVSSSMQWEERQAGVPQGAVLSPVLANLYLTSFDQFVSNITKSYVRFADDFIIWCNTQEEAQTLHKKIEKHLKANLKLSLNTPIISEVSTGVEFLGIFINKFCATITEEKKEHLHTRIRQIEIKNSSLSGKYLKSLDGIFRYYSKILPKEYTIDFENTLRVAITDWIAKNSKYNKNELLKIFKDLSKFQLFNPDSSITLPEIIKEGMNNRISGEKETTNLNKKIINSRKLEYQRREADNSELVISSYGYYLGLSDNGISIRRKGVKVASPPSAALKHITILSEGVSLSSNVISYCMARNIPIDFFDIKNNHIASIVSPRFLQTTLWNVQCNLSPEKQCNIAKKIIDGKLRNQLNLVKYFHKYHKDVINDNVHYTQVEIQFKNILKSIKEIQYSENYKEEIMAQEAQAAILYWDYIRFLIKDDNIAFECRMHKGATDLVNCMLNYGYAILYPRIWQAILSHKLNPYIGFVHYQEGNANLVFDIIELFRAQAVDRMIISMIQKKEKIAIQDGLLTDETKSLLVKNIFERFNRYEKYRGRECKFIDIINKQVTELSQYITSESTIYRPYIAKW